MKLFNINRKVPTAITLILIVISCLLIIYISITYIFPLSAIRSEYLAGNARSATIESLYLDKWDWIAFILALVTLVMGIITAVSQWQTQKNTMKITPESQRQLLLDYSRHFFRNLIVIKAVRAKLNSRYSEFYPSEEHILKLKADMSNLHPAVFFNNIQYYQSICELATLLRNYNLEIDVMLKHITNRNLSPEVKDRDFDTLEFKMGFLTHNVCKTIEQIWGKKEFGKSTRRMREIINGNISSKKGENTTLVDEAVQYFANPENGYFLNKFETNLLNSLFNCATQKEIDDMLRDINILIYIEMKGRNSTGSEIIFLIPFSD